MNSAREVPYLVKSQKLVRRAAIRRILAGRFHANGIKTYEELIAELETQAGIRASKETISRDLREMGAVKVTDEDRQNIKWWVLPAFNPYIEDLRNELDPDLIEAEVGHKLAAHAVGITPVGDRVFVMTEARAGPLVAYWISWLSWPGIIMVQEQLDAAVINCTNDETAIAVALRLLGDRRLEDFSE